MRPLSFNLGQYDVDDVFQADLALAASISPRAFARLDAVWGYIETAPGHYDWADLDRRIYEALAHGLRPHLVVPYWPPTFRRGGLPDKTQLQDQGSIDAYVAFVKALAARYDGLRFVELGNECNIQDPFAPDGTKPAFQAHLADLIAPLFSSTWHLCTPGLAPSSDHYDGNGNPTSLSPPTFLAEYWSSLLPATRQRIRFVGAHPYGRVSDVAQSWSPLGQLTPMHKFTNRPIIATEYNSDWNDSDSAKATNVPLGLNYMRSLGFVERVFVYAVSDKSTDSTFRLGMVNADRSERSIAGTVRTWATTQ